MDRLSEKTCEQASKRACDDDDDETHELNLLNRVELRLRQSERTVKQTGNAEERTENLFMERKINENVE